MTLNRANTEPNPDIARPTRAVVLAGGGGLRANPASKVTNKCLFSVHDHSLVERQINLIRDQLGITDIIIVVGHLKQQVMEYLGDGSRWGVGVRYVEVERVEDGPALGLLAAKAYLDRPFFLLLGDEFHNTSRHDCLFEYLDRRPDVLFTYIHTIDPYRVMSNFSLGIGEDDSVEWIKEKPRDVESDLCGCGTMYLTPRAVAAIENAKPSEVTGRVELYEAAASLIPAGKVYAVDLDDPGYFNVNTLEDLQRARFTYRTRKFDEFSISVVMPAWNEAQSIEYVIKDFKARPQVDEIVVADNLSEDGTGEIAQRAGARVLSRRYVGYGDAVKAALDAATGDVLVVVEADYTFRAADLPKILEYLKDSDVVIGTRTTREFVHQSANMSVLQRVANVALAKYLELLFIWLQPRFTDVGCSYRAIWRPEWESMRDQVIEKGPSFTVEMMIETVRARKRCIEIPVSYHPRFGGESKHTQNMVGLIKTGTAMAWMITSRWLQDVGRLASHWLRGERSQ